MTKILMALSVTLPVMAQASTMESLESRVSKLEQMLSKPQSNWYCEVPCTYHYTIVPNGAGKGNNPASAVKDAQTNCASRGGEAENIKDLSKACLKY